MSSYREQHELVHSNLQHHATELISKTNNSRSLLNSVVAGYIAGVTGTIAGHPMDSAKVWLQTNMRQGGPSASTLSSAANTLAQGANKMSFQSMTSRVRALYAGMTGPLLTVGVIQSLNFSLYDTTRRILYGLDHGGQVQGMEYLDHDSMHNVAIAGLTAGTAMSLLTSPLLVIKTQQQTTGNKFQTALRQAMEARKYQTGGTLRLRHLYVGFTPHLAFETINRAVYFCTYEKLKRWLSQGREVQLKDRCISAAAAGTACWLVMFPADAIRSRLYALPYAEDPPSSLQMARQMYHQGGVRAFYRGFVVTCIRAGPVAAAILPVYDLTLAKLSSL